MKTNGKLLKNNNETLEDLNFNKILFLIVIFDQINI